MHHGVQQRKQTVRRKMWARKGGTALLGAGIGTAKGQDMCKPRDLSGTGAMTTLPSSLLDTLRTRHSRPSERAESRGLHWPWVPLR